VPIRERIALFAALVVALTVLLFSLLIYGLTRKSLVSARDASLDARSTVARIAIEQNGVAGPLRGGLSAGSIDLASSEDAFSEVLDADGAVRYSEAELNGQPPAIPLATIAQAADRGARTVPLPGGVALRIAVKSWQRAGQSGYVVAGQSDRAITRQLNGLRFVLVLFGLICLAGAVVAMWLVARAALAPLTLMARTADAIADTSDLSRRLPPRAIHDDVGLLTTSFNAMLGRLQDVYARLAAALEVQKRFVSDASHELRTPLTTIRNNAGLLLARGDVSKEDRHAALQDIADEGERMARLVQQLLQLARADAGQRLLLTPLDLRPLIDDVVRQAQAIHIERAVRVAVRQDAGVNGNADALRQLLWILIDNAARHTTEGGAITVSLDRDGANALLAVADDGEGIPPAALEHLFERFFQADAARSAGGAGLGLAIAGWIAAEHGGALTACNRPSGGAEFTLTLPLDGVASGR
jgi:two-component system, OmpR family, sensor kinase